MVNAGPPSKGVSRRFHLLGWHLAALLGLLLAAGHGGAEAATSGAIYDMRGILNQPHPFATAPARTAAPALARQPAPPATRGGLMRPASQDGARPPAAVRQPMAEPGPGTPAQVAQQPQAGGDAGMLSEIRLGALAHDQGPFSSHKESGYDGNLEFIFTSPDFMEAVWSPKPIIGGTVNSAGNTHQAYLGLTWEFAPWKEWFVNLTWGGAYHTGATKAAARDKKELGCSVLFREAIDFGVTLGGNHRLMLHLDHISNAKLCATNEGLENAGIRYGYKF